MTLFADITLDSEELTTVDGDRTPAHGTAICGCGKVQERGGPMSLAGIPVADWPCCSGTLNGRRGHWAYCSTIGRITADVR